MVVYGWKWVFLVMICFGAQSSDYWVFFGDDTLFLVMSVCVQIKFSGFTIMTKKNRKVRNSLQCESKTGAA